ncbi:MAG TPA: SgcJ/EcaC family oxidoreductase [Candidatus Binatia bacterium]|nr:SgcJ/EcaC family oxidoreductase [Candidatus Binatia bacterium]
MATGNSQKNDEAQIRKLVDNWAKALRGKDVDGLMANYATDMVLFDLAPPLQYKGAAAYRKSWEQWLPTFQGPIGFDRREVNITAGNDVAFFHCLNRITGKRKDGTESDVWVRATVCFRKIDGEWMVAHEHVSVPFYMDGSYKAAIDLKP